MMQEEEEERARATLWEEEKSRFLAASITSIQDISNIIKLI